MRPGAVAFDFALFELQAGVVPLERLIDGLGSERGVEFHVEGGLTDELGGGEGKMDSESGAVM